MVMIVSAKRKVCPIPRNKIELLNMDEGAIKSHAKGKKHCSRLALYIQSGRIKFTSVSKESAESLLLLLFQVLWLNL